MNTTTPTRLWCVDSSTLVNVAKFSGIAFALVHWDLMLIPESSNISVIMPGYMADGQLTIWREGLLVLFLLGCAGWFLLLKGSLLSKLLLFVLPIPEIIYSYSPWYLVVVTYISICVGMVLSYCCNRFWNCYGIDITKPGVKNARAADISILVIICIGIVLSGYAHLYLLHLYDGYE